MLLKIISPRGKYKDEDCYNAITRYCLNPEKAIDGLVATVGVRPDHIPEDMLALANRHEKNKGTRIRHMVLSFDPDKEAHITPQLALVIVKKILTFYQGEYQCIGVIHQNKAHVHAHVIMNTVRISDGQKYKGRKREWYAFLNHVKKVIRLYHLKLQLTY